LLDTPNSRIVTVSSVGHRVRSKIDVDTVAGTDGLDRVAAYGRSKLANLLFIYELQRRLAATGATTAALAAHPGLSDIELIRNSPKVLQWGEFLFRPLMQSAQRGALPTLRAATDPTAQGGEYYGPDGIGEARGNPRFVESGSRSHDAELQRSLWEKSVEMTGVDYPLRSRAVSASVFGYVRT
jgi:NAD(P)-dependent dehydrogenase (short-subunit alcohol dehydrogenase family)